MTRLRYATFVYIAGAAMVFPTACGTTGPPVLSGSADNTDGGGAGSSVGGGDASSNSSTASGDVEPSTCENLPDEIDPSSLPLCPSSVCGGGARCLPSALVINNGGPEQAAMLAPCEEPDSLCVPDEFVKTQGLFTPKTCTSLLNAEGRCLSTCLPQVKEQLELTQIPQDICDEHQVCVPCYDPQTGESTTACDLSCDAGPSEEPVLLPACCEGLGKCVPTDAVPSDKLESLAEYECAEEAGAGFICAPNVFIEDLNFKPAACEKIGFLAKMFLPPQYQAGRCLPDCLPQLDDAPVSQGDCQENFLCTPCYKPSFFGPPEPTGACDL